MEFKKNPIVDEKKSEPVKRKTENQDYLRHKHQVSRVDALVNPYSSSYLQISKNP